MAHFAQIDENNLVLQVVKTDNNKPNEGLDWLVKRFGGTWLKTSYNTYRNQHLEGGVPYRGNFAVVGGIYDNEKDAFIPPKPFPSWIFDDAILDWKAPVPYPKQEFGQAFLWDEEQQAWVLVTD